MTAPLAGSSRSNSAPRVTHTAPAPAARPVAVPPTRKTRRTAPDAGSRRRTVAPPASWPSTQTPPAPTTIRDGAGPTGT